MLVPKHVSIPRSKRPIFPFAIALAVIVTTVTAQPVISELESLPTSDTSTAFAINSDGSSAVGEAYWYTYHNRAVLWKADAGILDLGVLPDCTDSAAYSINADGDMAVGASWGGGKRRAFMWTPANGIVDLGVLAGGLYSEARAINSAGSRIAGWSSASDGLTHACTWEAGGTIHALDMLANCAYAVATGMTTDGAIVVGAASGPSASRAVRWLTNGTAQDLGYLPYGQRAWARAVSANGSAVVGSCLTGQDIESSHAFRWTSINGMKDLGILPGELWAEAYDISGDGSTVVGYCDGGIGTRAFIWTQEIGIVEMRSFLASIGVDVTGWELDCAYAISPDGSAVVGTGYHNGIQRAWRLTGLPRIGGCPGDFNHDGFVNGDDYDAFAELFDNAQAAADFNHDGFVNGDDYDAFASVFENGC